MRRTRSPRAFRAIAAVSAVTLISAASARGQNLFTNPSFETGDLANWTTGAGGMFVGADGAPIGSTVAVVNARTGNFALAKLSQQSQISQTVAVAPDTLYEIGAWTSVGRTNIIVGGVMDVGDGTTNVAHLNPNNDNPGSSTDFGFSRVRRLYRTAPDQTSATISFAVSVDTAMSFDDFFMTPWASPIATPATATGRLAGIGDASPSDAGGGTLAVLDPPLVAPRTTRSFAFASNGTFTGNVVLRDNGDGTTSLPARAGASVAGGGTLAGLSAPSVSDDGRLAFVTGLNTLASPSVFRQDDQTGISLVATPGMTVPEGGATFSSFETVRSTDAGVVFRANVSSGGSSGIYYKPDGGPMQRVARDGQSLPGGGTLSFGFSAAFAANNNGAVVFYPASTSPGTPNALYLYDNGALQRLATYSEAFRGFDTLAMNDVGDVALGAISDRLAFQRIDLRHNGVYGTLLAKGQAAPGGGGAFNAFSAPSINPAGQLAFAAELSDGTSGIFRADAGGNVTPIVRSTDATPDGAGPFRGFVYKGMGTNLPRVPSIASGGQVAFTNALETNQTEAALYLADPSEVVYVARWGQELFGGTITELLWKGGRVQLNDFGQIGYGARLADGRVVNALYTPTLHWRAATSGDWATNANWTVGLPPAAMHPVKIDSPTGVMVTGPSGSTTVKSLDVTAGNELALVAASNLTVTEGVTLAGVLSGSGTITGDVTSTGTISPGHSAGAITIEGDLVSPGRIDLELLEDSFDQLIVTGALDLTDADIFVLGAADGGRTFNLIIAGSITGTPTWHLPGESSFAVVPNPSGGQTIQVTYVPEPTAIALAAVMGGAGALRRRRRIL
jgi:hypothetical protein